MKKRIISLLMALVLAFSLLPTAAFAADHADQVRVIVENTTYTAADAPWTGTLVDKWVDLKSDSTVMSCVVDALGSYPQSGASSGYISEINGLKAGAGGNYMAGWMGTLNDWFTNAGFSEFTVKDGTLKAGDEIHLMYSMNGGEDLGGSWGNTDKTVKNVTFSAGTLDKAFDKNTHEYTLTIPADVSSVVVTPTASNKNYQVRTSVGGTEYARTAEVPVADGAVITVKCGDPSWPSMNANDGEAQSYTFKVEQEGANRAPTIRGDAAAEATLEVGMSYTLDLSKIFVDVNGDELTYQWYQKNNANPTAAPYKLPEKDYYVDVNTPTLRLSVSAEACMDDYSYYCVIGRKGDPSDTLKTAEAKLTATHAYSHKQAGVPVPTDDSERTPEYKVTWVDKNGNTHNGVVGGNPKCDGHKLPCLFEAGEYEAHYMTTGSKERIFPHTFVLDRSLEAVGGGKVDVLRCSVCDYIVPVKSHVHDYGWNWDYTGFGSIYEYTFNIGGSTKTVEQLILESDYAHPEKCKVPGCEEFIMVPHSWGRWNVVLCPDTTGGKGGMEAECSICEYTKTKIDKDNDGGADHWTKDTALVTVKNGRATRMIVKPGDKIRLYPEERNGQKAIGWKVEYLREYNDYDIISGTGLPVNKKWNTDEAKTLFKLVTNGSALEWGCEIPAFSAMGAPGGGQFFFEPVYAACDHSGGTTVLNAKAQVCDRKGYTGDTACADCGHVISAGSDIYPPANAGHTGTLQPLYYYGTNNSATTDASHGGKRYNARSGDCRHRAYEGDYRCTACGGTVKGETGDFKHSGPFELRDERAATCTEKGYSGNQYCTACDRIAQKGSSTPSLHEIAGNYKLVNEVKPGCTAAGYSGDQQCTAGCGQIIRYGHVVNKLSHDWDGGKPATQGKSEGILYTCQRADCGETRFVKNPTAPGYTVTVIKGTASVAAGTLITDKIAQNTVVTVTADAPEAGKVFDKWVVLEGNVTLADATKATTTFTMPASAVKIEATYKDAPPSHPHSYGTDWKYDDTNHWHECECGDKADVAAHSYVWKTDKEATKFKDGSKHEECSVCGAVRNAGTIIPATLGHCWIIDFIISVKDFVIGATKGTVEFIISAFKQIIGK